MGHPGNSNGVLLLQAEVELGQLSPHDVEVQAFHGPVDADELVSPTLTPMVREGEDNRYTATLTPPHGGAFGYTARIVPRHELLGSAALGLVRDAAPGLGS
jgi:starch phosphorylase